MQIEIGTFCPLIKKECVRFKCAWFMKLSGMDRNTGKQVDEWGCSIAWLPHLLVENSNQQRETGAAVESFRNEMTKQNSAIGQALLEKIDGNI